MYNNLRILHAVYGMRYENIRSAKQRKSPRRSDIGSALKAIHRILDNVDRDSQRR